MTTSSEAGARRLLRDALHRQLPAHFEDPLGLAVRLARSRNRDAYGAAGQALAALLLTPVDLALVRSERRIEESASEPTRPVLIVCGPPRSGTTLTAQILLSGLGLTRITNFATLFPRSPNAASRLARSFLRPAPPTFASFYGRTHRLGGANDGLVFWDRWFGTDRDRPRTSLEPVEAFGLRRFFGALESDGGRPVLAKNNSLDVHAGLVLDALPTAHVICLTRDSVALARSLLRARRDIHGDASRPYGVTHPGTPSPDPEEDVCRQVLFHEAAIAGQRKALGRRFWVRTYEEVCADPHRLVREVAEQVLGEDVNPEYLHAVPEQFTPSTGVEGAAVNARLRALLEQLRSRADAPPAAPSTGT